MSWMSCQYFKNIPTRNSTYSYVRKCFKYSKTSCLLFVNFRWHILKKNEVASAPLTALCQFFLCHLPEKIINVYAFRLLTIQIYITYHDARHFLSYVKVWTCFEQCFLVRKVTPTNKCTVHHICIINTLFILF